MAFDRDRHLVYLIAGISLQVTIKMKRPPEIHKPKDRLIQMIRVEDKATGQKGLVDKSINFSVNLKTSFNKIYFSICRESEALLSVTK